MKDRTLLVKLFYKNEDCAVAALRIFRSLNGRKKECGPMSKKALRIMIKNIEATGSFAVKSGRKRK